ncbi:flightin [Stomoxys calcitrans]|uniref:Flightin n=1 Tax=Stomoxys calcitrans TaxID=35570 RepID=A0A1I8QDH3_STOCA|nr:flightin [Stomoxys calcitrans]
MGDEEDPWGADDSEQQPEPTPVVAQQPVAPDTKATTEAPPTSEEKGSTEAEVAPPPPPVEDDGYRKPVQLYRHWVRPKFLQYKYMYNYRTNYYDDVIDYLDKRQIGVSREIPRPQTWAERILRSNYSNSRGLDFESSIKRDHQLIQTLAASIRPHNYHTKAYINQKYAKVL